MLNCFWPYIGTNSINRLFQVVQLLVVDPRSSVDKCELYIVIILIFLLHETHWEYMCVHTIPGIQSVGLVTNERVTAVTVSLYTILKVGVARLSKGTTGSRKEICCKSSFRSI